MISKEAQEAMQQWLVQATPPEQQWDRRWIGRYRELTSQDSFWWLSWAGPFTEEEQQQWDRLFHPPLDEITKEQLGPLLKQSREREVEAALAEQREPHFHYPAIEFDDVRHRIVGLTQLDTEIEQREPNAIVRRLYHGMIENDVNYLRIIEAAYEEDTERYWMFNRRMYDQPTPDEMAHAFSWVRRLLQQGFEHSETAEASQQLLSFIQEQLHLSLDLSVGKNDPPVAIELNPVEKPRSISLEAARQFYRTVLCEGGYEGWQVNIDTAGGVTRVEWSLRQLILAEGSFTVEKIRHLLAHELAGHVARSFAGEHSPIGLLGIGTRGYESIEEGLAIYHERRVDALHGRVFDDSGAISGTLATGLASGVVTPPLTFSSLCKFFELFIFLYRRLLRPWQDEERDRESTRRLAIGRCLRTFRGVPDLKRAGICYLQDVTYLRGLLQVVRLAVEDTTALEQLTVGMVAYELLPTLQPLKLLPPPQPLRELAYDPDLDNYILSFEVSEGGDAKPA
ncbi:MAG: hypothetical protein WCD86_15455 [Ktedonobacteraceae bacterium]